MAVNFICVRRHIVHVDESDGESSKLFIFTPMLQNLEKYVEETQALINSGQYFAAHNLGEEALSLYPDSVRIKHLLGVALAKLGLTDKARKFLWAGYQQNEQDEELAGALGSVIKDQFRQTGDTQFARLSKEIYLENYRLTQSYYTGINAATCSLVTGEDKQAGSIADELISYLEQQPQHNFWTMATLGEAYLIRGALTPAMQWYERAKQVVGKDFGKIQSVFAQLKFLRSYLSVPDELLHLFHPPIIVTFTGHMIDRPDSKEKRFPTHIEDSVADKIKQVLEELDVQIGYCSLACGADIIFAEAMLARGAEINIYLPYAKDDFIATSVAFAGESWVERFNAILRSQKVKIMSDEKYYGTPDHHAFMGKVLIGLSMLRARILDTEPFLISLLKQSKRKKPKPGGSNYLVTHWPFKDRLITIDPSQFIVRRHKKKPDIVLDLPPFKPVENTTSAIRFIFFADIVGFSKLPELMRVTFVDQFLHQVAKEMRQQDLRLEVINTWGDSIVAVSKDILHIMDFTAIVRSAIVRLNQVHTFSKQEVNIRIALHAGPVFKVYDPLIRKKSVAGSHIIRAARMEPITIPGSVYASAPFAAFLTAEAPDAYRIEHVGIINLPKGYGQEEIYQITKI